MVSAVTVSGCTNASVVFGWIVATLLHHTRGRKVERKFLDVLNTPDGQSQHWVPGAALPQYKTRYRSVLE
eukprot:Em0012g783a